MKRQKQFSRRLLVVSSFICMLMFSGGCVVTGTNETVGQATLLPTPQPAITGTPQPEMGEALEAAYPAPSDEAYPVLPSETPVTLGVYPPADDGLSPTPETLPDGSGTPASVFFPMIGEGRPPTVTPTATPPPSPTVAPSPTPEPTSLSALAEPTPIAVVDFAAIRDNLAGNGQELAYNKIGFHVTFLEDRDELDGWMQRLDQEGVPFFLKSVDNAEPIYRAQELMKASGVPHTLVYRSTRHDVPDYNLPPEQAAEMDWAAETAIWPPELDPSLVWFETLNEPDKERSEWLARFALRTAQLALRDGYKWAAFGWASGEPEPADWESPAMLELLRLIGENPDQLAIALHEYSYLAEDIGHEYPYKVGRFLNLFRIAEKYDIPRPTVLITEWGWTYNNIPPEPDAMEDIAWAARLYGAYPQVKGAAIWNLGRLEDQLLPLNEQVQGLVDNMLALSLDSYFVAPQLPQQAPLDADQFPPPR